MSDERFSEMVEKVAQAMYPFIDMRPGDSLNARRMARAALEAAGVKELLAEIKTMADDYERHGQEDYDKQKRSRAEGNEAIANYYEGKGELCGGVAWRLRKLLDAKGTP